MMSHYKILMVNLPFSGHTNPTLELARTLVSLGHEVGYVHAPEWREKVEQTGAAFIPYDNYPSDLSEYRKIIKSFGAAYNTVLRVGKAYDCLVYEMLFVSGKTLADHLGIPSVRLFSTFSLNETIIKEFAYTGGWYMTAMFRYPIFYRWLSKRLQKRFDWKYPDMVLEITQNAPELNFTYTVKNFQPYAERFDATHYYWVGPSIGNRHEAPFDFTKMTKPIIYISLGTLLNRSVSFFKLCIEAFRNEPVSVILSIGHHIKPDQLGQLPHNIFVYSFVPQLEILQKTSLFITHGGMNSVNEALYYGCPMLVIPVGNDQPRVAQQVAELHLGRRLNRKGLTAEALKLAADEVLRDQEGLYQHHLNQFKENAQSAGSNTMIARMIEDMLNKRKEKPYR